jgi:hypothetical protein
VEFLISAISKILKAFEDVVRVELGKVRWEEIKKVTSSAIVCGT